MLYIVAIILGIAVGIIAKGKASNLLNLRFEKAWLIISAFAVQILTQILVSRGVTFTIKYGFAIQAAVFCMLLIGFWFNRRYLGMWVIGAGCLLNAVVMMMNGGKMPVGYEALVKANAPKLAQSLIAGADSRHTIISRSTKLPFLTDIINLPKYIDFGHQIVSVGDLVVLVGVFILVMGVVLDKTLEVKN